MRIICVLLSHFIPLSDYQFKHKFLSIIFLRRGKKMSCYFYILCKYWRKHLRTALSLLFSGLLLTAIITSVFLFIREEINREVETGYDTFGKYDLILSGIPDDIKNELIPSDLTFTHETVTVPGKADFYGKEYNYGYTDKACNLLHVPMKNGSMPFLKMKPLSSSRFSKVSVISENRRQHNNKRQAVYSYGHYRQGVLRKTAVRKSRIYR